MRLYYGMIYASGGSAQVKAAHDAIMGRLVVSGEAQEVGLLPSTPTLSRIRFSGVGTDIVEHLRRISIDHALVELGVMYECRDPDNSTFGANVFKAGSVLLNETGSDTDKMSQEIIVRFFRED